MKLVQLSVLFCLYIYIYVYLFFNLYSRPAQISCTSKIHLLKVGAKIKYKISRVRNLLSNKWAAETCAYK
jgi:hypothetical protein